MICSGFFIQLSYYIFIIFYCFLRNEAFNCYNVAFSLFYSQTPQRIRQSRSTQEPEPTIYRDGIGGIWQGYGVDIIPKFRRRFWCVRFAPIWNSLRLREGGTHHRQDEEYDVGFHGNAGRGYGMRTRRRVVEKVSPETRRTYTPGARASPRTSKVAGCAGAIAP